MTTTRGFMDCDDDEDGVYWPWWRDVPWGIVGLAGVAITLLVVGLVM